MIKFIVLFVASVELAGHKARGLMLRGSRQILQPPYFSNSESQLDAGKSYLQVNKNNGKSLFKNNLYLQQDEQEQEQSYLQGKEEMEEIERLLIKNRFTSPQNVLKGLNRLKFDVHVDPFKRVMKLLEKLNSRDMWESEQAYKCLIKLDAVGSGSPKYSTETLIKDLSMRIHYLEVGHQESMRKLLGQLGEKMHTEKIISGLRRLYSDPYEQFQIMPKLVEKRRSGSPSEQEQARQCIRAIIDIGVRGIRSDYSINNLRENIRDLTGENRELIEHQLGRMGGEWNVENIDRGLNRLKLPRAKQLAYLQTIKETFFSMFSSEDPSDNKRRARSCLDKISELGSGKVSNPEAEMLMKEILDLVKPKSE